MTARYLGLSKSLVWIAADATEREAITVVEAEVGSACYQQDTEQTFIAAKIGSGAACWRLGTSKFRDGVTVVTLTDGSSIALDLSQGNVYQVTLGGDRTLAAPTNGVVGKSYYLKVLQDGTGSRTLSYNAVYHAAGGSITVTATADHWDWLKITCLASNIFLVEQVADVSALA